MRRKGAVSDTVLLVVSLVIGFILLTVLVSNIMVVAAKDTETLTRMKGLAVRNIIVGVSNMEEALRKYDISPEFKISVSSDSVQIDYQGSLKCEDCTFTFSHFADNVQSSTVSNAETICIVKKVVDDKARIEVCAADGACCSI